MSAPVATVSDLLDGRRVMVCCGPGGVGKTTVAAALAMEGARRGRRSVVVTIDPARRLGDALGHGSLGAIPTRLEGDWPGELWALMLDTESTFDALVRKYAPRGEQATSILENRFYRNIAGALSGTQEYMAMEKLFELHGDERFDLIVVDTPPTRNALDFIEAPGRLIRFLDNRMFRLLMVPTRASFKAANIATRAFLRTISRVVGGDVVQDAVTFFQAFEGMEEGFRLRAQRVGQLMTDPDTAFVIVTSPRRDAVEEALFFAEKLEEAAILVQGLVVNRLHPRFDKGRPGSAGPAGAMAAAKAAREQAGTLAGTPLAVLYENLADLSEMAAGEEAQLRSVVERVAPAPVARVPCLAGDVHDLAGVAEVGSYVVAG